MGAHNILSKADRAVVAYLISVGAGTAADVVPMKLSEDKPLPCTIVHSRSADVTHPYSGTWTVQTSIIVRSTAAPDVGEAKDAPKAASESRVEAAFDALMAGFDSAGDKLAAEITTAARASGAVDMTTFTVIDVTPKAVDQGFDAKGNSWEDSLDLEIVCCAANVA